MLAKVQAEALKQGGRTVGAGVAGSGVPEDGDGRAGAVRCCGRGKAGPRRVNGLCPWPRDPRLTRCVKEGSEGERGGEYRKRGDGLMRASRGSSGVIVTRKTLQHQFPRTAVAPARGPLRATHAHPPPPHPPSASWAVSALGRPPLGPSPSHCYVKGILKWAQENDVLKYSSSLNATSFTSPNLFLYSQNALI